MSYSSIACVIKVIDNNNSNNDGDDDDKWTSG